MSLTKHNIPTGYEEARALLNPDGRRKISHAGLLYLRLDDGVTLMLHNTDIVTWWKDGAITINTGGWDTVTTRSWINRALQGGGFRVSRRKGVLTVWHQSALGDLAWDGSPLKLNPHPGTVWTSPEPDEVAS